METLIFLFSTFATVIGQMSCPDGWTNYGTSCYAYFNINADFVHASQYCDTFGGAYLAEIEHETENIQLKNYMALQNTEHTHGVWLGGNDKLIEGMWTWDKTETAVMYFDWESGQPDDNGHKAQDCLSMWKEFSFRWADHYCHETLSFICEMTAK